ncbi:hypothetical protein Daura_01375 [Dactylosporangium aurantiacum]|uniref:Uncharacterized protein n=1 Tax=Dactylosporangium aurantiacum TaxID=35754 RepID=A0A9Q9IJB3_9ACTN|nr:hypothetical protein [Dactylosporangium aurantiacum]MDG6100984.1 hypothetical protein [Dactylosporangium aurantiacum]UWZ54967.1 hypothetical protein Daura_01375 [Dactylosporangium aurantiacum]
MRHPPVWLLDVDGVINVRRPLWGPSLHRGTASSAGIDWPIRWAPALITRIRRLAATRLLEIRWCTTWCPDADALERLFHLPPLGRALSAADLDEAEETDRVKLAAAREVLAAGRRLVWTDDTAVPDPGPVAAELTAGGRALLIKPHSRRGLRPSDLARIESFARQVRYAA